jgi:hypothetical protein
VIEELRRAYPDWKVKDEAERARVNKLKIKRQRGKGAPKKRRSAAGMVYSVLLGLCRMLTCGCSRIEEIAEEETWTGQSGARGMRWPTFERSMGIWIHVRRLAWTGPLNWILAHWSSYRRQNRSRHQLGIVRSLIGIAPGKYV